MPTGYPNDIFVMIKNLKVNQETGCKEWTASLDHSGYGRARFKGKYWIAHRLVYSLLVGEIPKGMFVLHRCDNPKCCNIEHLFLGTNQDNATDKVNKGRSMFGEKHYAAKLNENQVINILNLFKKGKRQCDIAKEFAVHPNTITAITHQKTWKYLHKNNKEASNDV